MILADVRRAVQGEDLLHGSDLARDVLALRRERDALLGNVRQRVAAQAGDEGLGEQVESK
jgi:hypothetical protein